MRLAELWSEAWRNVISGASRSFLFGSGFTIVVGALVTVDVITARDLAQTSAEFRRAGAATVVLVAPGSISGSACDRLADIEGVAAAGAVQTSASRVLTLSAPDNPLEVHEATPGFAGVLGRPRTEGLMLDAHAAHTYGVNPGGALLTRQGTLRLSEVFDYPDDGRDPMLFDAAVATSRSRARFDQCWATIWPYDPSAWSAMATAVVPSATAGAPTSQSQLNGRLGERLTVAEAYADRPTRWAPLVAGIAGLITALMGAFRRRLELAHARHLGLTISEQSWQLVLEWAFTLPASVAVLACTVTALVAPPQAWLFELAARIVASGVVGAIAGAALGALVVRDRQLFGYFKGR
ncbi:hypothetical protein [Nocardioides sp.]|uniref:hypothetical protein n=1 Tax=Nocardioides sp. TaxID=35761 RepID=UPI003D0E0996